jgi:hypothetical protein
MDLTDGSETSENHNLTPGKYPKEHIQRYFSSYKHPDHSGAHPGSIPCIQGALSLWVMQPECEAHHSPQSSAMVKNECSYAFTPLHAFTTRTRTPVTVEQLQAGHNA